MTGRSPRRTVSGLATMVAVWLAAGAVFGEIQINPRGWKFPNIITAAKEMIRPSDRTPLIPGKETLLKGYRKADGTRFMTYEIEGRVFGVQIDTDGKFPFEYGIMDTDGDGIFETKIIPDKHTQDQGYVPQWVVDYYYSKHPEMKNPSGKVRPPSPSLTTEPPPAPKPTPPPKAVRPPPEVLAQPNP